MRKKKQKILKERIHEVKENNLNQEVIFLWCDMQVAARTICFHCRYYMIFIVLYFLRNSKNYKNIKTGCKFYNSTRLSSANGSERSSSMIFQCHI